MTVPTPDFELPKFDVPKFDVPKFDLPDVDLSKFEANPVVQDFGNLLTVNDLCRYVESKVGAAD